MPELEEEGPDEEFERIPLHEAPLIQIVEPIEEHYWRDIGDFVQVKKPVELHVTGVEREDFVRKFPSELFHLVKAQRARGIEKVHVVYDPEDRKAGFIKKTANDMGFYEWGQRLALDASKFDEHAKEHAHRYK